MKLLSILFFASLLLGQVGGIPVSAGVVIYIHDVLLGLLFIKGCVQYTRTRMFTKPKLTIPLSLFIVAAILSLLINSGNIALPALGVSSLYLVRWIWYALLYVLVIQVYTKKEFWEYGLYASGVGVGVLGLIQFFLYPDLRNLVYLGWDPHFYRLFGTFLDPNFTGLFLVLTILLGMYLWHNKKYRLWVTFGEGISVVSVLLTYSRSSFLALGTAIVAWAVFKKQWKLFLGLTVFTVLVLLLPKTWGNTLNLVRLDSSLARVGNWQESLTLIGKSPIFGYGFDTLRYVRILPWGPFFSKAAAGFDSSILFIMATTGAIGLVAYGNLIFAMMKMGISRLRSLQSATLGTVYVTSLIALGFHSLFVNSAFYPWIMMWFWIVTGIVEKEGS